MEGGGFEPPKAEPSDLQSDPFGHSGTPPQYAANNNIELLKLVFTLYSAKKKVVEGGGFEPPKAEPSDLQSDPFGHSGTPPEHEADIIKIITAVKLFF